VARWLPLPLLRVNRLEGPNQHIQQRVGDRVAQASKRRRVARQTRVARLRLALGEERRQRDPRYKSKQRQNQVQE
jgi:hypothetical protein